MYKDRLDQDLALVCLEMKCYDTYTKYTYNDYRKTFFLSKKYNPNGEKYAQLPFPPFNSSMNTTIKNIEKHFLSPNTTMTDLQRMMLNRLHYYTDKYVNNPKDYYGISLPVFYHPLYEILLNFSIAINASIEKGSDNFPDVWKKAAKASWNKANTFITNTYPKDEEKNYGVCFPDKSITKLLYEHYFQKIFAIPLIELLASCENLKQTYDMLPTIYGFESMNWEMISLCDFLSPITEAFFWKHVSEVIENNHALVTKKLSPIQYNEWLLKKKEDGQLFSDVPFPEQIEPLILGLKKREEELLQKYNKLSNEELINIIIPQNE